MATKLEKRLDLLEKALLVGGGAVVGRYGLAAPARVVGRAAVLTPTGRLAMAGVTYAALREELNERDREMLAEQGASLEQQELYQRAQRFSPSISTVGLATKVALTKRKVSKANKAVKYGMKLLKSGSKASTGADKGKLPKGSFKTATVAAGLANPKTPSIIGKGKSKVKALARRIKKWW